MPVPVRGLDPFIGLSTAVHAAPGVYALLLGSGVSTAASIPTGWQIVTDLVRRAAAARDPRLAVPTDGFDPERWWGEYGDNEPLGYSSLLSSLSPTPAGRDLLLRGYFEPSDEDRAAGRKLPTLAHHAVADLVARGAINVVVTTNFDRLLEQALEQRGIQPQVLHRGEQIAAMTPLQHRDITVVKLHGDYADLDKRNTVDELEVYPELQQALLDRIVDEYGLIICGWSGEWDKALVRSIESLKSRRYPLFWSSHRAPSEAARRLITQTGAVRIDNTGADALFSGLRERLEALDRLASPPLNRMIAVARMKRYLPDPVRRIDLHDLVMGELGRVEVALNDRDRYPIARPAGVPADRFWPYFDESATRYRADVDILLNLLAAGAFFGGPQQSALWTAVVQRLLGQPRNYGPNVNEALRNLARYPALLAMTCLLAVGALRDRDDLVVPALIAPRLRDLNLQREQPAAVVAHPWRVFDNDSVNEMRRWSTRFQYAPSHLLRADLDDVLAPFEPDGTRREAAFDMAEYLMAVAQSTTEFAVPFMGEFVLRGQWSQGPLEVAVQVRSKVADGRGDLLPSLFGGDVDGAMAVLDGVDAEVERSLRRSALR